ncbi:ribonuclease P protein component [Candidatus Daviesbacteria bacterium]|nr:ribonuclease P protein component [Candidatus Daviesbacteria bacterium]
MLPKNKRLNLSKSFKWVAKGDKKETKYLKLNFRLGENENPLIGIALSKIYFPKSTQRNKAKRLAFSATDLTYPLLIKNLNLVIMPKVNILKANPTLVAKDLQNVQDIIIPN